MIKRHLTRWLSGALVLLGTWSASAHTSYTGRNFGTVVPDASPVVITGQAVTSNYGWADGLDADFGDSHRVRAFRFNLAAPSFVTITFAGSTNGGTKDGTIKPGFSVYKGLAHVAPITNAPGSADHDTAAISLAYLASLGGVPKEGCFRALKTWRMGGDNQSGPTFDFDAPDGLSTFTFVDYVADGNSSLFGNVPGVVGDGNADGTVTKSLYLNAGDYSIFVGGVNYAGQLPTPNATSYGLTGTISAATGGIGYAHAVTLDGESTAGFSDHVGAWSWEDNSLFGGTGQGTQPVGWTHTSKWVALRLLRDTNVTITMARDANVPWPSAEFPERKASVASMYPSMTVYRGWDTDGDDNHTYNNRGNIGWAEDTSYVDHYDNSSLETFTRTWFLPAGDYSLALGSNSPATDSDRQGFSIAFSTQGSSLSDPVPSPAGIGYLRTLTLADGQSGNFSSHVGAWSWEDNALFAPGQPPVGWTHTSDWLALNVEQESFITLTMERDANVPWPSVENPDRKADITSMFPSLTVFRGWDNDPVPPEFRVRPDIVAAWAPYGGVPADLGDHHTYNNRGNVIWAEELRYFDHVDNSTRTSITRTWRLPRGRYSVVLGSNAPANNSNRQGYKLSYSATAFNQIYTGDPAPAGIGYSWIVTAGRGNSGSVSSHVGAWSWEDNSLFGGVGQGTDPVGWTHTSKWLGLHVTEPVTFNVTMSRNATVPWPSVEDPNRLADTTSMFPSFTLWRNWYNDGDDDHTYNNRGAVSWASDLQYIDHLDNSTSETVTRSWTLTPGHYTFALGSNSAATDSDRQGFTFAWTTSNPAYESPIITKQPVNATVVAGKAASFTVGAAGPGVQIQWMHGGTPVPGATTSTLKIENVDTDDAGIYTAQVRNSAGSLMTNPATLTVIVPPVFTPPGSALELTIGQASGITLGAVPNSLYVIRGLPRGLDYDRRTGAITGRPVVSGSFDITVQLINAAGSSTTTAVTLDIDPMPSGTVGTFTGIVERSQQVNSLLGGSLSLTSTDLGAFSATLRLGGATYRGRQLLTVTQGSTTPTGSIDFPVRGRSPIEVDFTIQSTSGVAEGTITSNGQAIPFTVRKPVAAPADFVGDHTFALGLSDTDAGNEDLPNGYSFGTLVVSSTGLASGTVRLADNTEVTFSGPVEVDGNVSVYQPLYRNTGSILGLFTIEGGVGNGDLRLSDLDWFKAPLASTSRERSYKDGFGPLLLETVGRRIDRTEAPLAALDLTANALGNASLSFAEGGAPDPATRLDVTVEVKAGDAQAAAVVGDNPGQVSLITRRPLPAAGLRRGQAGPCTGQFTLVDADNTVSPTVNRTRRVGFQGMIVNDAGTPKVFGFFLLPQMPQAGPPATTLANSPILSGKVLLEPLAP